MPYLLLAWIILTVILFVQQGNRFTEIFFAANIPWRLLLDLTAALLLTVTAFTAPLAALGGIVIGLGQLRGESELTALQAAGVSRFRIVLPCLLLGLLISLGSLWINLRGVPLAAQIVRRVAVEAALAKLESPIEPGVFNTEFKDYVIYVRDGNNERGVWEKVFIYLPEPDQIRLITARVGRIDQSQNKSELVLGDAVVTTLPAHMENRAVTVDKVNSWRVTLDTGRAQLTKNLQSVARVPDEMGLTELRQYARTKTGGERTELNILWNRRLALACAPLCLSLLGAAAALRFARGGRGGAALLALTLAVVYYLLTLSGEQLARAGTLPVWAGSWLPTALILAGGLLAVVKAPFNRLVEQIRHLYRRKSDAPYKSAFIREPESELKADERENSVAVADSASDADFNQRPQKSGKFKFRFNFNAAALGKIKYPGLLEFDLFKNLAAYFLLTAAGLILLFHVFTAFEVLRGVTNLPNGWLLLARYLLLLTPWIGWQIAPTALMIAALIVYTVKARQNETVVWSAAGQSIYVLLLPAILAAALAGWAGWEVQEQILPATNPRQDALRAQLRGIGSTAQKENQFWAALPNGIVQFKGGKGSDNEAGKDFTFYEFDQNQIHLSAVTQAQTAVWQNSAVLLSGKIGSAVWKERSLDLNSATETKKTENAVLTDFSDNPFDQTSKIADQNSAELTRTIETAQSANERQRLEIALQQKRATLFLPIVIVFFTVPLVLSLRRQSLTRSICAAIALWLLFLAVMAILNRIGTAGVLPAWIAVWSPLLLFSSIGWIFLARTKT